MMAFHQLMDQILTSLGQAVQALKAQTDSLTIL
jgi:hypothetical protein